MDPLKEMFNREFYLNFAGVLERTEKNFNAKAFVREVTDGLGALSLNGRLRNTAIVLKKHLPFTYKQTIEILYRAAPSLPGGYTALVLPDFVGLYGKEDVGLSLEALKYFTVFGSSEFAIREFLRTDLARTIAVMEKWAEDRSAHVRRLASEGSRPRLP
ncbi:hypothetical protein ACX0G9_04275 [Flavitalea flava]